jgi:hypothetical protein
MQMPPDDPDLLRAALFLLAQARVGKEPPPMSEFLPVMKRLLAKRDAFIDGDDRFVRVEVLRKTMQEVVATVRQSFPPASPAAEEAIDELFAQIEAKAASLFAGKVH